MVVWLRAMVLWNEATNALHGFSPDDLIDIGCASIDCQISNIFCLYIPQGLVRGLADWINNANDFEGGVNLILQLRRIYLLANSRRGEER
ncbi:hypothetical protein HDR70_03485 [bacterium]|nr:hypothetical protein [bacterium]